MVGVEWLWFVGAAPPCALRGEPAIQVPMKEELGGRGRAQLRVNHVRQASTPGKRAGRADTHLKVPPRTLSASPFSPDYPCLEENASRFSRLGCSFPSHGWR